MKNCEKYILDRKSIRKFRGKNIEREKLEFLIDAGQRAPTAGNMQPYSFVVVENDTKREKLYALSWDQECVKKAPLLIYVCVDLRREKLFMERYGGRCYEDGGMGELLFPIIDASLAAENIITAAETAGLGSVVVGTPTEYPEDVAALLELPEKVYPLMLLCIGYPDETPRKKYRWDRSAVLHCDSYKDVKEEEVKSYAKKVEDFRGKKIEEIIKKIEKNYPKKELKEAFKRMNKFFK